MNLSLSHTCLAPIILFHLPKGNHKSLWVTPTILSDFSEQNQTKLNTHTHPLILKAKISANDHPNQDDQNKQRHIHKIKRVAK